VNIQYSVFIYR